MCAFATPNPPGAPDVPVQPADPASQHPSSSLRQVCYQLPCANRQVCDQNLRNDMVDLFNANDNRNPVEKALHTCECLLRAVRS